MAGFATLLRFVCVFLKTHEIENNVERESDEHQMLKREQYFVLPRKVKRWVVSTAKARICYNHVHNEVPVRNKHTVVGYKEVLFAAFLAQVDLIYMFLIYIWISATKQTPITVLST